MPKFIIAEIGWLYPRDNAVATLPTWSSSQITEANFDASKWDTSAPHQITVDPGLTIPEPWRSTIKGTRLIIRQVNPFFGSLFFREAPGVELAGLYQQEFIVNAYTSMSGLLEAVDGEIWRIPDVVAEDGGSLPDQTEDSWYITYAPLRFTDKPGGFVSTPASDVPDVSYEDRILSAGDFSCFGRSKRWDWPLIGGGGFDGTEGLLVFSNVDGKYDFMRGSSVDGQRIKISYGEEEDDVDNFGGFSRSIFAGYGVGTPGVDLRSVSIPLSDQLAAIVDKPFQRDLMAGFGSALRCDGTGDFLTITHHSDFNFTDDMTVAVLITLENLPVNDTVPKSTMTIYNKRTSGGTSPMELEAYAVSIGGTVQIQGLCTDDVAATDSVTVDVALDADNDTENRFLWIVFSHRGGSGDLYLSAWWLGDDKPVAEVLDTATSLSGTLKTNSENARIGTHAGGHNGSDLEGMIAEFRLYNRSWMAAEEHLEQIRGPLDPDDAEEMSGCVVYLDINEGIGIEELVNQSRLANISNIGDAAISGNPTWDTTGTGHRNQIGTPYPVVIGENRYCALVKVDEIDTGSIYAVHSRHVQEVITVFTQDGVGMAQEGWSVTGTFTFGGSGNNRIFAFDDDDVTFRGAVPGQDITLTNFMASWNTDEIIANVNRQRRMIRLQGTHAGSNVDDTGTIATKTGTGGWAVWREGGDKSDFRQMPHLIQITDTHDGVISALVDGDDVGGFVTHSPDVIVRMLTDFGPGIPGYLISKEDVGRYFTKSGWSTGEDIVTVSDVLEPVSTGAGINICVAEDGEIRIFDILPLGQFPLTGQDYIEEDIIDVRSIQIPNSPSNIRLGFGRSPVKGNPPNGAWNRFKGFLTEEYRVFDYPVRVPQVDDSGNITLDLPVQAILPSAEPSRVIPTGLIQDRRRAFCAAFHLGQMSYSSLFEISISLIRLAAGGLGRPHTYDLTHQGRSSRFGLDGSKTYYPTSVTKNLDTMTAVQEVLEPRTAAPSIQSRKYPRFDTAAPARADLGESVWNFKANGRFLISYVFAVMSGTHTGDEWLIGLNYDGSTRTILAGFNSGLRPTIRLRNGSGGTNDLNPFAANDGHDSDELATGEIHHHMWYWDGSTVYGWSNGTRGSTTLTFSNLRNDGANTPVECMIGTMEGDWTIGEIRVASGRNFTLAQLDQLATIKRPLLPNELEIFESTYSMREGSGTRIHESLGRTTPIALPADVVWTSYT